MDECIVKSLRNWKINKCILNQGAISNTIEVSATLYLNRKCIANNHIDVDMLVENLANNPATLIPTYSMNKLLDENIELNEKIEKLQNELNEIKSALKIIYELGNGD